MSKAKAIPIETKDGEAILRNAGKVWRNQTIICSDYMSKLMSTGLWKRRYVCLLRKPGDKEEHYLTYWDSPEEMAKSEEGKKTLTIIPYITRVDVDKERYSEKKGLFVFQVTAKAGADSFTFRTNTHKEMEIWIEQIRRTCFSTPSERLHQVTPEYLVRQGVPKFAATKIYCTLSNAGFKEVNGLYRAVGVKNGATMFQHSVNKTLISRENVNNAFGWVIGAVPDAYYIVSQEAALLPPIAGVWKCYKGIPPLPFIELHEKENGATKPKNDRESAAKSIPYYSSEEESDDEMTWKEEVMEDHSKSEEKQVLRKLSKLGYSKAGKFSFPVESMGTATDKRGDNPNPGSMITATIIAKKGHRSMSHTTAALEQLASLGYGAENRGLERSTKATTADASNVRRLSSPCENDTPPPPPPPTHSPSKSRTPSRKTSSGAVTMKFPVSARMHNELDDVPPPPPYDAMSPAARGNRSSKHAYGATMPTPRFAMSGSEDSSLPPPPPMPDTYEGTDNAGSGTPHHSEKYKLAKQASGRRKSSLRGLMENKFSGLTQSNYLDIDFLPPPPATSPPPVPSTPGSGYLPPPPPHAPPPPHEVPFEIPLPSRPHPSTATSPARKKSTLINAESPSRRKNSSTIVLSDTPPRKKSSARASLVVQVPSPFNDSSAAFIAPPPRMPPPPSAKRYVPAAEDWQRLVDPSSNLFYYFNKVTMESVWDVPPELQ